ncbi:MAG: phosphonate ABC transporter ATP-binding protein [Cyanobacteria bacterium P01_D01_bin.123]
MDKRAIVSLDRVGVAYSNGAIALESVSLDLHQSEFAIVLGSSGAGKSTLLRTINHLHPPTQGNVTAMGVGDLTQPASLRLHRKRTGMIFQQHQLIDRHSALKNVLMGRLAYHSFWRSLLPLPLADRQIALDCLERVNLLDKAVTPVKSLSGGQKQRVGIARALAQQPHLMLADEPIASLDPASAHQILSLLHNICKRDGIAALLSLHQVEFAKQYGDRIIGLSSGRVIFDASPAALSARHLNEIYASEPLATRV